MNTEQKALVNKTIEDVLNRFVGEENNQETRNKIGYDIKNALEKLEVDFETINLYTTPEDEKEGIIDIRIDNNLFPFDVIEEVNQSNWGEYVANWECGELSDNDTIKLFQYLIDEGHAWKLQGFYGRTAEELIQVGFCTLSYKKTEGHQIFGSPTIPTKFDLKPGSPGTDEYVQKRKELKTDDAFWAWVEEQGFVD